MKRLLIVLVLMLVASAGIAVALLPNANVQRLTEIVLSTTLGRELRIEGTLSFSFGAPLRLVATSVWLANPEWADRPLMATAERVEVAIDPWTLLGREPLIIEDLQIISLEGELISDELGRANWAFGGEDEENTTDFLIRELDVRNTVLTLRRPSHEPVPFEIETLRQTETSEGLLQTTLAGQFNGRPTKADGQLGPFQNLLRGEDVRVVVNASFGSLEINGSGLIDNLTNPHQPELRIELATRDALDIAEMFGFEHPMDGDINLQLDIEPASSGISLMAEGRWGGNRLNIQGWIADLPNLDGIEMTASGSGGNFRDAFQFLGLRGLPDLPFRFGGDVARHGSELNIRELEFFAGEYLFELHGDMGEFPSLNDATLHLRAKADDLAVFAETFGLTGLPTGNFAMDGQLGRGPDGRDGFRFEAETVVGTGILSGTLGNAPGYEGSRAAFRAAGRSLRQLGDLMGLTGLREQPFELEGEFELLADGYRLVDEATLVAGESSIGVTGVLGAAPLEQGTKLTWRLNELDLAEASNAMGLSKSFPSHPLSATGRLKVEPTSFRLDAVRGSLAEADFTLEGQLGRGKAFGGTDLRMTMKGPDLSQLDFLAGTVKLPGGAFDFSGRIQRTAKGLRCSECRVALVGARGRLDGELALPTDRLHLGFNVLLEGEDVAGFWQDRFEFSLPSVPFTIEARGEVNDGSWRIDESLVSLGAHHVTVNGVVQRNQGKSVLRIRAESPDVSVPGGWYGLELPDSGLQLTGTLELDEDVLRLNDFVAHTGKGDLAGDLTYIPGTPPRVEGALTAANLDFSGLLEPPDGLSADAGESTRGGRTIPDWSLPLEPLRRVNAKLSLEADGITVWQRTFANARIELVLEDGALDLAPLSFSGDDGVFNAELRVTPLAEGADLSLRVAANGLYTGLLLPDREDLHALPRGNWNLALRARGGTLRELAANLNGTGKLDSTAGRVAHTRAQSLAFGAFSTSVISAVNPFYRSEPYTDIVCSVFPFTFTDGLMESAPTLVLQTDKLNILSQGTIDLRTERLDLDFRTEARRGLGISAGSVVNPLIRIRGTLAEPRLNLNPGSALASGGAAFFTAGLSLLAQAALNAAFRSSDPCGNVFEESKKRFSKKADG